MKSKVSELSTINKVRVIGTGMDSMVFLALLTKNQKTTPYALKVINKEKAAKLKHIQYIKNEKKILMSLDHPFIIKLYSLIRYKTYQDESCVYFLEEFAQGGEIFSRIRIWHYLPNDVALFYAVEILLAFEYLHSRSIVYRDLKCENVLIDHEGHVKLVDFGFSKEVQPGEMLKTLCGTADYLAPEIINGQGYSFSADWWAFGVLLYEFLCGYPPFFDRVPMKIYEKILLGKVDIPVELPKSAAQLLGRLLTLDIEKRIGYEGGAEEIKSASWFNGVDFSLALRKEVKPPWIPRFISETDATAFSYFPEENSLYSPAGPAINQYFSDF